MTEWYRGDTISRCATKNHTWREVTNAKKLFKDNCDFNNALMLCTIMASTALAAYTNWTSYETSFIAAGSSTTSDNTSIRYTNNDKFRVYAKDMTMISNPKAKVVNSEGYSRSDWVTIKETGVYYTGTNNICEKDYEYKLKIKAAFNQIGTDAIKYKFSVR